MCGISVLIDNNNQPVSTELIRQMNDKVAHRGPDDEGYYYGENFAFGHRRLSIVDTSNAGHQPMQKGTDCIVFNGMIYNYIELRKELIGAGYSFTSQTDTEVILAAYQHWNTDAFKRFNGMWAIGIYDAPAQKIIFSRDHFGIKPLYYTTHNNYFAAASEIKQFTVLPGFNPVLNSSVTVNFLAKGWLNYSDETFFNGVSALTPGHYLEYSLPDKSHSLHEWYNLKKNVTTVPHDFEKATTTVSNLFRQSVQMRMRADVKVGSCLSGGIDSSSIVSVIHEQQSANEYFTTFTSCYTDKRYDEQQYSDVVTRQTGFTAVKVFPDLRHLLTAGDLDTMLYHQDQPFSSASHYSEFSVFKTAQANQMKVILDGQGADEYFCGYPEFLTEYIASYLRRGKFRKAIKAAGFTKEAGAVVAKRWKALWTVWVWYPIIKRAKRWLGKDDYPWMSEKAQSRLKGENIDFTAKGIRALSLEQLVYSSIPYQLHSEDRNSMMFSIESRLPFLDHRLVEYVLGLPADYKINHGYTKYILRQALPELPQLVRWRKDKLGFAAPDKEWVYQNHEMIRNELKQASDELPFFSAVLLERFDRFIKGELGYEPIYFRAMALNRFCRIFKMEIRG